MSFMHHLVVGYLNKEAALNRQILVEQPIDIQKAHHALSKIGEQLSENTYTISGDIVTLHDGYIICPMYSPTYNTMIHDFVKTFAEDQHCLVADIEHARLIEPPDSAV